ncbi:MAG: hypothetical protein ACWGHV_10850 [Stutzerimonas stutzeri]
MDDVFAPRRPRSAPTAGMIQRHLPDGSEEARGKLSEPWDYYKVLATMPGDEAYIKPANSGCELVTQ